MFNLLPPSPWLPPSSGFAEFSPTLNQLSWGLLIPLLIFTNRQLCLLAREEHQAGSLIPLGRASAWQDVGDAQEDLAWDHVQHPSRLRCGIWEQRDTSG